jgi:hypothetical protein
MFFCFNSFPVTIAAEFERSAKKSPALALQQHAVGFSVDVVDNSAQVERDPSPDFLPISPAHFLDAPTYFSGAAVAAHHPPGHAAADVCTSR